MRVAFEVALHSSWNQHRDVEVFWSCKGKVPRFPSFENAVTSGRE